MPGPDLEPLPELDPEAVLKLQVTYAGHTASQNDRLFCRCGRSNPCEARQAIYTRLVGAGYPPKAGPPDSDEQPPRPG